MKVNRRIKTTGQLCSTVTQQEHYEWCAGEWGFCPVLRVLHTVVCASSLN